MAALHWSNLTSTRQFILWASFSDGFQLKYLTSQFPLKTMKVISFLLISTHFSSSSVGSLANHTYVWHDALLLRINMVLPKIRQSPSFFFLPSISLQLHHSKESNIWCCILELESEPSSGSTSPIKNSSWLSYAPLPRTEETDRGPCFSQAAFSFHSLPLPFLSLTSLLWHSLP